MNHLVFLLIIVAIIYYVIIPIGGMVVIIGICFAVISSLVGLVKLLRNYIIRSKNKRLFYDKLSSLYHIHTNQDYKINKKLLMAIDCILAKYYCPAELSQEFNNLKESIKDALNQSAIWRNNKILTEYSYKKKALSRNRISFTKSGFLGSRKSSCIDLFTIKAKGIKLHFYPYFIISEIDNEYELTKYIDFSITNMSSIDVEESSTSSIKGANPAYYNYLHQRIDGGPDRRYKNNPSTPVYIYDTFIFNLRKEVQLISASNKSTSNIIDSIKRYQCKIEKHQIESVISVKDIDMTDNEFANIIKGIIEKYGKDFILKKTFINYLKDYRVTKQYPYFTQIIEILYQSKFLEQIVQDSCSYDHLEQIKNTIRQSTTFSELEIATVLALIGNGVQLKI